MKNMDGFMTFENSNGINSPYNDFYSFLDKNTTVSFEFLVEDNIGEKQIVRQLNANNLTEIDQKVSNQKIIAIKHGKELRVFDTKSDVLEDLKKNTIDFYNDSGEKLDAVNFFKDLNVKTLDKTQFDALTKMVLQNLANQLKNTESNKKINDYKFTPLNKNSNHKNNHSFSRLSNSSKEEKEKVINKKEQSHLFNEKLIDEKNAEDYRKTERIKNQFIKDLTNADERKTNDLKKTLIKEGEI